MDIVRVGIYHEEFQIVIESHRVVEKTEYILISKRITHDVTSFTPSINKTTLQVVKH